MAQVAAAASAPSGRRQRVDRRFYISMAEPLVTVHAMVASTWLLLFLMQPEAAIQS